MQLSDTRIKMSEADSKLRITCRVMLLVVFYQIKASNADDKCSPPYNTLIGTTCFKFHKTKLTWSDAKSACEKEGHLLARVESEDHIRNIFLGISPGQVNTDTWPAWVGASSLGVGNFLIWMDDGARVVENVWRMQEQYYLPGLLEDCAAVDLSMHLSSFSCAWPRPYLCMHDVPSRMLYFGQTIPLFCHCSDGNCTHAGDCPTSNKCAPRWFGPGCQQKSLPNSLEGRLPDLFDNDDSTCLGKDVPYLIMQFGHKYKLTWIRLVLGQTGQLNDFQLSFPGKGGTCTDLLTVIVNTRTVDLACPTMTNAVDYVFVSWTGVKFLCSCYVNGGKNMMLMYNAISTTAHSHHTITPIDGAKSKSDLCVDETFNSIAPRYSVAFHFEFVPREIILYRRINPKGYQHLDGVVIRVYDEANYTLPVSQMSTNSVFSTVWLNPLLDKSITRIYVTLSNESIALRKGNMSICELEVFGDCPYGRFGLFCENKCIERCRTDACFDTGVCFHGERTATTITRTKKLSTTTRKSSAPIIFNMTSTFKPLRNSTYPKYPRTTANVLVNRTLALDNPQITATRPNKDTKTERRYRTPYPKNTQKDIIHKLRLSAFILGVSLIVLCSATGYVCRDNWRVSNTNHDYDSDIGSTQDSNFTSSMYASTSNMEESQSKSATVSSNTISTAMSGKSSQIE